MSSILEYWPIILTIAGTLTAAAKFYLDWLKIRELQYKLSKLKAEKDSLKSPIYKPTSEEIGKYSRPHSRSAPVIPALLSIFLITVISTTLFVYQYDLPPQPHTDSPPDYPKMPFPKIGPEMIMIPSGEFKMGSPTDEVGHSNVESPVHKVSIQNFAISKYEVTFEEYDLFAKDTRMPLPNDNGWGRAKQPAINISWNDTQAYVQWLSVKTGKKYRLPTEAEWEYINRGGILTRYWWGDKLGTNNANCQNCTELARNRAAPIGSFSPNPFGVYDTLGNTWEWVEDCWNNNYENAPSDGKALLIDKCDSRVIRGGSWLSTSINIRSATRKSFEKNVRSADIGFRIAMDL